MKIASGRIIISLVLFLQQIKHIILYKVVEILADFIMKFLVRGYTEDIGENALIRQKCGKIAGIIGIISNIFLFALKFIIGSISNSIAITADAINNLTDSGSSVVMLVGFKLSEKPADDEHPFGHARIEYISGLIISFIIIFLGIQLAVSSFGKILNPEDTQYGIAAFIAMGISVLLKFWQFFFYRAVGRKTKSETITATGRDSLNDVITTFALIIGAAIAILTGINIDGFMGLAVAIFILISGVKLVIETSNPLLGVAPDKEVVKQIYDRILSYDGIEGVHDLTVHNYGTGRRFASVHCEVTAEGDILESHDVIDNIERDFKNEMDIHLVIHMDPVIVGDEKTNALNAEICEIISQLYPSVSIHDFRVVWGPTHSNVLFDVAVAFSLKDSDSEIKQKITKAVVERNPEYNLIITVDRVSDMSDRTT